MIAMEQVEGVVIVGAGVSGLATALGLHRKGIRSLVLESSESLRAAGFALLMWPNAWRALDVLGVADILRSSHIQLQGLVMKSATSGGVITKQTFEGEELCLKQEVRSLKRNLLLEALAKDLPPGTIRYSAKVVHIEESGRLKLLHLADGSTLKTEVLIGCDGVNSVVAKWLGLRPPFYSGRSSCRGLVDYPFQSIITNRRIIQYFFGEGFRVGISHCDDKTLYWFFTWTPSNKVEKDSEGNAQQMRDLILTKLTSSKIPKEVLAAIEKSDESAGLVSALRFRWPFELLWGTICKDNVCVAGDALHPMTPDIGQGGCSALEDAVVLVRCLSKALSGDGKKAGNDKFERIGGGLKKFAGERRWRGFALISAAFLIGQVEERNGFLMRFLREKLLSGFMGWLQLRLTEFDCGTF